MAQEFRPNKCPKCKSENIMKEKMGGQHTGDWKCIDCRKVFDKFETEEWQSRLKP